MNFKILVTFGLLGLLSSCSKNETPQNTEPANYAETKEKLIQNPDKDSLKNDSVKVPTAMPPQNEPNVGNQ